MTHTNYVRPDWNTWHPIGHQHGHAHKHCIHPCWCNVHYCCGCQYSYLGTSPQIWTSPSTTGASSTTVASTSHTQHSHT